MQPSERNNVRKAKPDHPGYDQNRARIVEAAIEIMAEQGFQRLRFDELATRVDLNRTTIYRYFDSKRDLVTAAMKVLMYEITEEVIGDISPMRQTTPDVFTDNLYNVIHSMRTNPRYSVIMDAQNVEQFADLCAAHVAEIAMGIMSRYLSDEEIGDLLRDDLELGEVVHWLIHQIISYGFLGLKGDDEQAQKAYLGRMVVRAIFKS